MIKILGISGSRIKNGNTQALLGEALSHAQQSQAVETELIALAGKEINACNHCNWCIKKQMIPATSGLYQLGSGAYSSPEGKGRFVKEPRHIVLEDEYGVLSAKLLSDKVIELARIVKARQQTLYKGGVK